MSRSTFSLLALPLALALVGVFTSPSLVQAAVPLGPESVTLPIDQSRWQSWCAAGSEPARFACFHLAKGTYMDLTTPATNLPGVVMSSDQSKFGIACPKPKEAVQVDFQGNHSVRLATDGPGVCSITYLTGIENIGIQKTQVPFKTGQTYDFPSAEPSDI
ncbi:hypothetical protein BCV70DRAFT_200851 [Testicularia cyperi]|uniref:Uncharacterized protein n=1 Tax=Testicularia cyperi TaxID=1882483 RepID=A0A317XN78_9BASI|nr:hypothetical protein BCV70DRAFT_200851 [Testicularia cyperi]